MDLPAPSTPLERQITLDKWEELELFMKMHPAVYRMLVYKTPTHQYWLVRKHRKIVRVHQRA